MSASRGTEPPEGQASPYVFSLWKKVLCGVAICMAAAGAGLSAFGPSKAQEEQAPVAMPAGKAFLPEGWPPQQEAVQQEQPLWGPALLRGGAGFLIGFAVGYALRTLLRLSVVILGLVLLGLAALQYAGWININWQVVQSQLEGLGHYLKGQFQSFSTFLSGALPAAGFAGLGLFTGLKKH